MRHSEHCKKCKSVFLNSLEMEFGKVTDQWQSGWPYKIDDVLGLLDLDKKTAKSLGSIYRALQNYRGYQDFVCARRFPSSDYYIKRLNCLVEFDESQHFTAPRALALRLYPRTVQPGFDKEEWLNRCNTLNRHDNHPPYRDEQRAWYDTLRDILPACFGMNPTIRILAKEFIWCEDETKTAMIFRDYIGEYCVNNTKKKKFKKKIDLNLVKRNHARQAIAKIDKEGFPPGRAAKSTYLLFNRKYYPAKYVLGEAYKIATNKPLSPDDFHGGDSTAKRLSDLGFTVVRNGNSWNAEQSNGYKRLFRIFLKGTYDREKQEHNGSGFARWVIKNGNMSKERLCSIFSKLDELKGSYQNSVLLFPACTLVIKDAKDFRQWKSFLQKKSQGATIILGVMDLTRSNKSKEFTAVYNNGRYTEIDAGKPQSKLSCGNGWAYISSNINNHEYERDPGKFCFDLGHGAYTGRYKGTLRKISRLKNVIVVLTAWYKSPPSISWIYKKGKELPPKIKPLYTEHMDLIDEIRYPFVKNLFKQ